MSGGTYFVVVLIGSIYIGKSHSFSNEISDCLCAEDEVFRAIIQLFSPFIDTQRLAIILVPQIKILLMTT